ncbi:enoyl-CoA hydratase [Spartinivicinus ruber]|uniref:enoyl-CoA hydratase n=1 Tax=Spartinivicinus ruber TaxID=2683272 RepID=UPI0013D6266F|nr:enoyl-CoA hydratase [Spartinivicinus ruber]
MPDLVIVNQHEQLLRLKINRPDKKNALTNQMYSTLAEALVNANQNNEIRVVVIEGNPQCFTSGNDIHDFMQRPPTGTNSPVFHFLQALVELEKPLIAAVDGPAVGIGTTMLLHCDFVYVGDNAQLQMPFVKLALCPEGGATWLLPRLVGHRKAAELLLTSKKFGSEEAVSLGIASAQVPSAQLVDHAVDQANQLAALAPGAVQLSKRLLKQPIKEKLIEVMKQEGAEFIKRLSSPEAAEAMKAFLQKRPADFSQF